MTTPGAQQQNVPPDPWWACWDPPTRTQGHGAQPAADSACSRWQHHLAGSSADVALAERVIPESPRWFTVRSLTPTRCATASAWSPIADNESFTEVLTPDIPSRRGKTIRPKTLNQKRYCRCHRRQHRRSLASDRQAPARRIWRWPRRSTLQTKQVNRIILTRPAVEAGERLGFLARTSARRSICTCGRCTTRYTTYDGPQAIPKLMSAFYGD